MMCKISYYFVFYISMLSCRDKADKEKYIIPMGYRGRVTVFFNQINGAPKSFENDFRIYKIPDNGILLTRFEDNPGILSVENSELKYIYLDFSSGKQENITLKPLTPDSDKVYIMNGSSGRINGYSYYQFIVDTLKNISSYYEKNDQGFYSEPKDKWKEIFEKAGLFKNDK